VGVARDWPMFFKYPVPPIIPGMGKATDFKIWYAHSYDQSEQKPI